jgi:hypothetical protein
MSVIVENFTVHKGEDFSKEFTIRNPDKTLTNISSYSSPFAYVAKYAESENKTQLNVGIGTTTSKIQISLASTLTETLDSGRNYYNVFVNTGSQVIKIREGEILVNDSILV